MKLAFFALPFALFACSSSDAPAPPARCPKGLFPCGPGCIPASAVCCDDGSGKTSSYCANAAGGGCRPNTGACPAAFPSGSQAAFCCDASGSFGSFDCPPGQVHCGELCKPAGEPCCPPGASVDECPLAISDPACGTGQTEPVTPCGYCRNIPFCIFCPAGSCCQGDPTFDGEVCVNVFECVPSAGACPGIGGGGPTPDGGGPVDGGDCPGGWIGSSQVCTPLGPGGSCNCIGDSPLCITPALFGGDLPAACAPEGTADCLDNTGKLIRPCCSGLTCVGGNECGQTGTGVGRCMKR